MKMRILSLTLVSMFLASIFLIASLPSTQSQGEYDPWADIMEEFGKIDIFDVVAVASKYQTTGIPTRNVTVTNWPPWPSPGEMNITNWPLDDDGNLKISMNTIPSGLHTAIAEITVLDWSDIHDSFSGGIYVYQDSITSLFPFVFSPNGQLVNVTDFWIVIAEKLENTATNIGYSIRLNTATTIPTGLEFANRHAVTTRTLHIEDNSTLQAINSGINTLEFGGLGSNQFIYLYRVDVIIEYQYLG